MEKLMDFTEFLIIEISKQEIESNDFQPVFRTLNRLLEDKETILYFFERVEISVGGYENDPRELWEIPEVKKFIEELDTQFPYWFYFLTKYGAGLKMIAFCCSNLIKLTATKVWLDPDSLDKFFIKHFGAVNMLAYKINMTERENAELSKKITDYFSHNFKRI
ncbi:MAG: chlororespiratory reduction 6 domain-containing protein [Bacteroidetes bacterium]|nr:chlororespiratory reduction 6 domain-containing protein [Bacteroidota bacterium]